MTSSLEPIKWKLILIRELHMLKELPLVLNRVRAKLLMMVSNEYLLATEALSLTTILFHWDLCGLTRVYSDKPSRCPSADINKIKNQVKSDFL